MSIWYQYGVALRLTGVWRKIPKKRIAVLTKKRISGSRNAREDETFCLHSYAREGDHSFVAILPRARVIKLNRGRNPISGDVTYWFPVLPLLFVFKDRLIFGLSNGQDKGKQPQKTQKRSWGLLVPTFLGPVRPIRVSEPRTWSCTLLYSGYPWNLIFIVFWKWKWLLDSADIRHISQLWLVLR